MKRTYPLRLAREIQAQLSTTVLSLLKPLCSVCSNYKHTHTASQIMVITGHNDCIKIKINNCIITFSNDMH